MGIESDLLLAVAIFAAALLAFIMLSVCGNVVMRYFFDQPMHWILEVTEYCLLWITFLGTTWVLKREGHVVMDLAIGQLNPGARDMVSIFTSIAGTVVSLFLTWYGVKVTLDVFQRDLLLSTILTPPAYILFIIIPVGSLLLSIQFVIRTCGFINRRRGLSGKDTGISNESITQAMR